MSDFTYNGVSLQSLFDDYQLFIGVAQGRGFIAPDVSEVPYVGAHGSRFVQSRIPERKISVPFSLIGYCVDTERLVENRLQAAVTTRTPSVLQFPDQTGHYEAILTDVSVSEEHGTWASGTLEFTAFSPFLLGDMVTVDWADSLTVETNFEVEPIITLTASSAVSSFDVTVNGVTLSVAHAVTQAQDAVIDVAKKEIHIGNDLVALEVTGEWPVLGPENTLVKSLPGSGSITYQSRWL